MDIKINLIKLFMMQDLLLTTASFIKERDALFSENKTKQIFFSL